MLARMSAQPPVPWYREPLVWMVIAIPATAVVLGIVMLVISIQSYDGLVVDDYYKRGLEINRVLDRDQAAATHALSGELRIASGRMNLRLEAKPGFALPATLVLGFYHATRGGLDRTLTLTLGAEGTYDADFAPLAPGAWNVQAEAGDWRLLGRMVAGQRSPLVLTPADGTLAGGG